MSVDMSRYMECPMCHTFQGRLDPCRKCGWHSGKNEQWDLPKGPRCLKASVGLPGPRPKNGYLIKELAVLRALQDGEWHSLKELRDKGITDRWQPAAIQWQARLEGSGLIILDHPQKKFKRLSFRICYGKMQDAKRRMAELEGALDGEDERGKTEL